MDTPLNFTLRYAEGTNDLTDKTGDVAVVGTNGTILFEPTVRPGFRIPTTEGGLTPRTFECVMENGVLKTEAGGSADVRLWANDPSWSLARYSYRVRASLTDAEGIAVPWWPFEFDAPVIDTVKYLDEYMPRPGQKFGRGPASSVTGGQFGTGTLILKNNDGSATIPIDLAAGQLVFVNNGDGSVSAG